MVQTIGIDALKDFRTDFNKRLAVQKVIYLSQELGAKLGYRFGWYVRGPYSSGLADSMYSLSVSFESGWSAGGAGMIHPTGLPRMKKLLGSVEDVVKTTGKPREFWLELAASLHYLMKHSYPPAKTLKEATEELKQAKPKYTNDDIVIAYNLLKKWKLL